MHDVIERFLRYVKIDTQSDPESNSFPTTDKQKDLGRILASELNEMGAENVFFDEENCFVYAIIPSTDETKKNTVGFIAHMDTSPDASGTNVKPRLVYDYDGGEIVLNEEENLVLTPSLFPEMKNYKGQTLIVTDGNTLLGADDKAGVAEIMSMAKYLLEHKEIKHGRVAVAFSPDEEVGGGIDRFDIPRFGADYAYTVDGGGIGELEFENFNAAACEVYVHGMIVHPGSAKNKMKNAARIAMEFDSLLPSEQKPEYTDGYDGFIHLTHMSGETELARLSYIVRDHSKAKFEAKKTILEKAAEYLNAKYGENTVTVEIKDSYYNMREKIEPEYMFLIEQAKEEMVKLGITPIVSPVRGGTDGAHLSYMGLPCPNLFTGGHNYHGRFEYCCAESMIKATELLCAIACR